MVPILIFLIGSFLFWLNTYYLISFLYIIKGQQESISQRLLISALVIGLWIVIITEGLSLFSALSQSSVRILWASVFLIIFWSNAKLSLRYKIKSYLIIQELVDGIKGIWRGKKIKLILLSLILFQTIILLFTIIKYPIPNNVDSMDYHLARIMHWEQQANVSHFAAHNLRQITFPPFSEFAMMNSMLLLGSDKITRIVQWFSMVVSLIGVAEITRKLGGNSSQRLVAALLTVSIPMGILQATSTQNDYVLAAWLIIFLVFGLTLIKNINNPLAVIATGVALGLALFTKGTAYIFVLPLCAWFAYRGIRSQKLSPKILRIGLVVFAIVMTINFGHLWRNTITFANPIGENHEEINEILGVKVLISNIVRNIQIHMLPVSENYPDILNEINASISNLSRQIHDLSQLETDDPRTTFNGAYSGFNSPQGATLNESLAGNFIPMILIIISIPATFFVKNSAKVNQLYIVLIITFVLFSFVFKSHSHISRLQLPMFILWMPMISIILMSRNSKYIGYVAISIWILSLPWLFNNQYRPIIPQENDNRVYKLSNGIDLYFLNSVGLLNPAKEITDVILEKECPRLGFAFQTFEYPLWVMLKEGGFTGTINNVFVNNETSKFENANRLPCIILTYNRLDFLSGYKAYDIRGFLLYVEQ